MKADNPWTGISKEKLIPFLLTKVRGIPSNFNNERIAIGIKGKLVVCRIS